MCVGTDSDGVAPIGTDADGFDVEDDDTIGIRREGGEWKGGV